MAKDAFICNSPAQTNKWPMGPIHFNSFGLGSHLDTNAVFVFFFLFQSFENQFVSVNENKMDGTEWDGKGTSIQQQFCNWLSTIENVKYGALRFAKPKITLLLLCGVVLDRVCYYKLFCVIESFVFFFPLFVIISFFGRWYLRFCCCCSSIIIKHQATWFLDIVRVCAFVRNMNK